jgi:GxxExxY protein
MENISYEKKQMEMIEQRTIINIAERVYKQLGPGHNERIYHKAMTYELWCNGFSIDTEMNVVVSYTDSKEHTHFLESERVDIFIHSHNIIIELKAIQRDIQAQEICQIRKYFNELSKIGKNVSYGIIINFRQPNTKDIPDSIDVKIVET